jgi:hypothetical protein
MDKRLILIVVLSIAVVFSLAPNCPACYCGDGNLDEGEECEIGYPCPGGGICNTDTYDDIPDCTCEEVPDVCWLTGGGAKFEPIVGMKMATAGKGGPVISIGGNVNPGCSAIAGDGGNWNLIDHKAKLHFQGTHIEVVECGNIPESIRPPGSTSPKTPFNYIEFQGTGTIKGISGNDVNYDPVCFYARAEDRSEPGTKENLGSSFIDRFWISINDCAGAVLYQVGADVDDPDTICGDDSFACTDTIALTGGNLQIHISSCP